MVQKYKKVVYFLMLVVFASCGVIDGEGHVNSNPTVETVTVTQGQIDVDPTTDFIFEYTEYVDPPSVVPDAVNLNEGEGDDASSTRVDGDLDMPSSRTVRFTSRDELRSESVYTLRSRGVRAIDGSEFAYVSRTFTTRDTIAPSVDSNTPTDGASDIAVNTTVQAVFSEAMDSSTITTSTFTVSGTTGTVEYFPATLTAVFTPSSNLASFTAYTVTITTGVTDESGNAMAADYVSSFTTSDIVAPTVDSTSPTGSATDVAVDSLVTATFSENMDPATVDGVSFSLAKTAGGAVSASVGSLNVTATLTPDANLDFVTNYTATVTTDITDLSGNPLAANSSWSFDTETTYWMKTYGGTRTDAFNSVAPTSDGGFIAAGYYTDNWTAPTLWLVKLAFDGTVEWQNRFGSTSLSQVAKSVEQTSDGGYIVSGTYNDASARNWWIIKFDSTGTLTWQKSFDNSAGSTDNDQVNIVRQTSDGGYIAAGYIDVDGGSSDNWDLTVIKLDSSGTITWQKKYAEGVDDEAMDIQEVSGGYVVAGWAVFTGPTNFEAWALKLDSSGTIVWEKRYGGASSESIQSIIELSDGRYLFAGYTASEGAGGNDAWLVKIKSTDGTIVPGWEKAYGGGSADSASSVIENSDGNYVVTGYTDSSGSRKPWVFEVDAATGDDVNWEKVYGSGTNDTGNSIAQVSQDDGYIIGGKTFDFGDAPYANAWLLKVDSAGDIGACTEVGTPTAATVTTTSASVATTTATVSTTTLNVSTPTDSAVVTDGFKATQCVTP